MSRRLFPLLFALAACGNPDNYVLGSISAQGGAPVVIFDHINSAIHNTVLLTDAQTGNKIPADAIILTNHGDLCGALARPDYLQNPDDELIALMILAPPDKLGTFIVGSPDPQQIATRYSAILAAPGNKIATNLYPTSGGYVAVTDFAIGGEASGSFDLVFNDAQGPHEFQGRFKTRSCEALAAAALP